MIKKDNIYFVYILKSEKNGKLYMGSTEDVRKRVEYHNLGLQRHTKKWLPYILVYSEEHKTKTAALKRERFFKSGKGRDVLKRLINSGCSAAG